MCWKGRVWMVEGLCTPFLVSPPAAYPRLSSTASDDLSYVVTIILNQCLSYPSHHPSNFSIVPRRKSWLLNLDAVALLDSRNIYDALFLTTRSMLWDTRVPMTRSIQYQPESNVIGNQDVEISVDGPGSIFHARGDESNRF
ncbi:hypothetical protein BDM02DRAFT_3114194 [Thelephora ganbajun]|uniref:Uncharacterized protein n=1 Tax=Thelephora ganbajun TaxID=370292 RepID=A0ACB6ZHW1_THEGA|nr:hypothetical protein BDM02DRAFT_3114194 [Thelephora ganbajun]